MLDLIFHESFNINFFSFLKIVMEYQISDLGGGYVSVVIKGGNMIGYINCSFCVVPRGLLAEYVYTNWGFFFGILYFWPRNGMVPVTLSKILRNMLEVNAAHPQLTS